MLFFYKLLFVLLSSYLYSEGANVRNTVTYTAFSNIKNSTAFTSCEKSQMLEILLSYRLPDGTKFNAAREIAILSADDLEMESRDIEEVFDEKDRTGENINGMTRRKFELILEYMKDENNYEKLVDRLIFTIYRTINKCEL